MIEDTIQLNTVEPNHPKKSKKHRKLKSKKVRNISLCLLLLQAVLFVIFTFCLMHLDILPLKFFLPLEAILIAMIVGITFVTIKARTKQRLTVGIILGIVFDILMALGIYYTTISSNTLKNISEQAEAVATVDVYVRSDNSAETIDDAFDYTFGILSTLDRENTDEALADIEEETGYSVATQEYGSFTELSNALQNQEVDAIIMNEAYHDVLTEIEGYEDFDDITKVIATYQVTHATANTTEEATYDPNQDTVTIYISGIDSRSGLVTYSRSDVNILLTVNTKTKQVLMVTTPRDYYVPLSISNGVKDKLTHAGVYGIQCSMDTLSMLYDCDIDYYFRVNFGGFEEIVDALGGITVNSDYTFTSQTAEGTYYYVQGENELNGEEALGFARERHAFSDGDVQRGKNQMKVIEAIIDKMTSVEFLTNYTDVLNSLEGNFEMSIPQELISKVVKEQLDDGGDWNIVSYNVNGTSAYGETYSAPGEQLYVMEPDESTVEEAKSLMEQVRNGEEITQP